jgi:hypothetical protein
VDFAGISLMSNKKAAGMLFNPNGDLDPAQLVEMERARELAGSLNSYGKVSLVAGGRFAHNLRSFPSEILAHTVGQGSSKSRLLGLFQCAA